MRLPIFSPITTRDGTLLQDGKTVNAWAQKNIEGEFDAVKRPGLTLQQQLTGTFGQALLLAPRLPSVTSGPTDAYAIISDQLIDLSVANTYPLTPTNALDRFTVLNATIQQDGSFYAAVKNGTEFWNIGTFAQGGGLFIGGVLKVADPSYPPSSVPGIVYLDGTTYVMDYKGSIYGSTLYNPRTWSAANVTQTDRGIGRGVVISRHLNYLVAYAESGIQFFYDAGNPIPGSPLSPVQSATFGIGCASAFSIANIEDKTIFMSRNGTTGRHIVVIEGTNLRAISDTYIDRILNNDSLTFVTAYTVQSLGHTLYVLNLSANSTAGRTLVYDFTSNFWTVFTSVDATRSFLGAFAVSNPQNLGLHLMLGQTNGRVYNFDPTATSDYEGPIVVQVTTILYDGGTMKPKSLSVMNMVADNASGTLSVAHYNDDYITLQPTRSIDLSTDRKQLRVCGSFRRRAWVFTYTANTALRLKYLELEPELKS